MRRLAGALIAFAWTAGGAISAPTAKDGRPSLLVLRVRGEAIPGETLDGLAEVLAAEAGKTGRFQVLTYADVRARLEVERQKLNFDPDCDLTRCLAQIGQALGTDLVLSGTVARAGGVWIATVTLTNVRDVHSAGRGAREARGGLESLIDPLAAAAREAMGAAEGGGGGDPLRPSTDPLLVPRVLRRLEEGAADPALSRAIAARLAGEGPVNLPGLVEGLRHPEPGVRVVSAMSIEAMGARARGVVPPLLEALQDDAWAVRRSAVLALAAVAPGAGPGDARILEGLRRALKDEAPWVRLAAAEGLLRLSPGDGDAARSALRTALNHRNPEVRARAREILGRGEGPARGAGAP